MADRWEDYFDPGETLLWEGQPMPVTGWSWSALALAAFGMPFLLAGLGVSGAAVLSVFDIEVGMFEAAGSIFLFFFGLPFLAAGVGMVFGPWYVARNAHRTTRYALSDRRAYIASRLWTKSLEAVPILTDGTVTLENECNVYFRTEIGRDNDGDRVTERKGFLNIADAAKVYRLIRDIQNKADADE